MVSPACFRDVSVFPIKPGFHIIVLIVQVNSKISRQTGRLRRLLVSTRSSRSLQRRAVVSEVPGSNNKGLARFSQTK